MNQSGLSIKKTIIGTFFSLLTILGFYYFAFVNNQVSDKNPENAANTVIRDRTQTEDNFSQGFDPDTPLYEGTLDVYLTTPGDELESEEKPIDDELEELIIENEKNKSQESTSTPQEIIEDTR